MAPQWATPSTIRSWRPGLLDHLVPALTGGHVIPVSGQLLAEAILGSGSVPRTLIIDTNGPTVVMEG